MYLTRVEKPHPLGENLTVAQMKRCVIICSISEKRGAEERDVCHGR
jgi:hypothetical protein